MSEMLFMEAKLVLDRSRKYKYHSLKISVNGQSTPYSSVTGLEW